MCAGAQASRVSTGVIIFGESNNSKIENESKVRRSKRPCCFNTAENRLFKSQMKRSQVLV